jgi:hypothetical protein
MMSSAAFTAAGLYFILNQDLSHGSEHHAEAFEKHAEPEEEEAPDAPAEEGTKDTKEEPKAEEKSDGKKPPSPPDESDKPDPRKPSKSSNEMSGKQEALSNSDTRHSSEIDKQDEKSKKGEGVAESAKLKGTVSTDRPQAENKEERGKAQQDKEK